MKVPTELLGRYLNRVSAGRNLRQVKRRPHALAHHPQADEDNRGYHRPDNFQTVVAVRIGGALLVTSVAEFPHDPPETNLRGRKRDAYHDNSDEKLPVIRRPVLSNRRRKPPF